MIISLIAAVSENNVIGKKNEIPWNVRADLAHFSKLTTDHSVIMGKNTYESIFSRIGKPLPNRQNIILSDFNDYVANGCIVVNSINEALKKVVSEEVFVIGGAMVYKSTINLAAKLYITIIHANVDGDTFFPQIDTNTWVEKSRNDFARDKNNEYDYSFVEFVRRELVQ